MYCPNCGSQNDDASNNCVNCGAPLKENVNNEEPLKGTVTGGNGSNNETPKSKMAAGILGILLGTWGVHNFYLGYQKKAIIQLCLGLGGFITCGITSLGSAVWGLIEGIQILTGSINKDANGNSLAD